MGIKKRKINRCFNSGRKRKRFVNMMKKNKNKLKYFLVVRCEVSKEKEKEVTEKKELWEIRIQRVRRVSWEILR